MKKRIACLILSLAVIFGIAAYNGTQAWFATGVDKHQYINSGEIKYLLEGNLVSIDADKEVLPGLELVENKLSLYNYSTIDTQIRIIIEYSYYDSNGNYVTAEYKGNDDESGLLEVIMAPEWIKDSSSSDDNHYYYNGPDYIVKPAEISVATTSSESETTTALSDNGAVSEINLISSIKYSGPKTTIENSGKIVNLKILIESKQADYVTWTQLTEISTNS